MRLRLVTMLLALAGLGLAGEARAAAVCERLQAQLASASQGPGSPAQFRRYDRAVRKQAGQLDRVRSDLHRYGCGLLIIGGANRTACRKLATAEAKMQANLRALERKRAAYAGGRGGTSRRRIEAALRANGCFDQPAPQRLAVAPPTATAAPEPSRDELLRAAARAGRDELSRLRDFSEGGPADARGFGLTPAQDSSRIVVEHRSGFGGHLRTLCVRTCDGYYFPISSAATPADFARDQRACRMMCPDTRTELYYHSIYGQTSEDMVSASTGRPYNALPEAFAYRRATSGSTPDCGCDITAYYKEMLRREALLKGEPLPSGSQETSKLGAGDQATDPASDISAMRYYRTEEPGTKTEANGDSAQEAATTSAARSLDEQTRPVRVVGPVFLPAAAGEKLDFTANTETLADLFN